MGEIQHEQGHLEEAIKSVERSLEIESQLATDDPGSLDSSISMAKGHALLGQILLGRPAGLEPALTEYQEAVRLLEKITPPTSGTR